MKGPRGAAQIARYADRFAAIGAEPRLRILQLLLMAHPQGLVVGDIQEEMGIPASTLSHHLDKLKNEELVGVRREGTFLWYTANTEALHELIGFLYAECCSRNKAIEPGALVSIRQISHKTPKGKTNGHRKHQGSGERKVRAGGLARGHGR
ncbi:MAG: helix-turn-helix transcriptional regulator [Acidobacteria bacterium]|nr:helix-turn-helix transcriptional regulator [Acidobacteriota bacterium]